MTQRFRRLVLKTPKMFVGENWDTDGLHSLIKEIINLAVKPEALNNCTQLQIILSKDGSISMIDNGRSIPKDQIEDAMTWIVWEVALQRSSLYKKCGFIGVFGFVLNCVSQKLVLETVKDGITYQLVCSKGEIVEHLHEVPSTNTKGTLLTFTPDEEVFEGAKFNSDRLTKYLSELSKEYPNIHFSFDDKTTEKSVVFE